MPSVRSAAARHVGWAVLALLPATLYFWLRANPAYDPKTVAPEQHFYVVSMASLICFALAITGVRVALRTQSPRVYLVSLGFLLTAGVFSVHGLATPGFFLTREYAVVTGFSARMALWLGAFFLVVSAIPLSERTASRFANARMPVFFGAGLAIVAYTVAALLFPDSVPPRIMKASWFLNGTLVTVSLMTAVAAVTYGRMYAKSGVAMEGALAVAAVLMFEAQFVMHFAVLWHWSWWLYHLQLLAAFSTMLAYPLEVANAQRAQRAPERPTEARAA